MGFEFWRTKTDESIDKYGNFIIDYPIYEGRKAGINTVIFVIEKKNYQIFKDTISKRVEDKVETHILFSVIGFDF